MRKTDMNMRLKEVFKVVGDNVARFRGGKMDRTELARRANLARQTISRVEEGNAVGVETLVKISDALNIQLIDLFAKKETRLNVPFKLEWLFNQPYSVMTDRQLEEMRKIARGELRKMMREELREELKEIKEELKEFLKR